MKKLAHEEIIDQMKARIISGEWNPGDRLPTMQSLAEHFKLSITSVREALRILENQRIVSIEHGRGVFITNNPNLIENPMANIPDIENSSLLQLLEARLVIEPELAAFCAIRASTAHQRELVILADTMEEQMRQGGDHFSTDVRFHQNIAEGADNPFLAKMLSVLSDLSAEGRRATDKLPNMKTKALSYHKLLAIAITERQAEQAHTLMKSHIQDMINSLIERR